MSIFTKNQLEEIWKKTLDDLKSSAFVDSGIIGMYKDAYLYDINEEFVIIATNSFVVKSILDSQQSLIQSTIMKYSQKDLPLKIMEEKNLSTLHNSSLQQTQSHIKNKLLDKYTFDNFVVGVSNRESQAAAVACSVNPGEFFNPLFIYGNSGLGKTHLLHAIGNYVKEHAPDKKVLYIYSDDFIQLIVNSIKDQTIESVKNEINSCDYLLIDDIQRLKQGERSQEIFFNLYNNLFSKGKQIVITSDIHPTELKGIENRLISRFSSGLSVGIDSPEFETSLAILEKKIEERGDQILIEKPVLEYIATTYSSDVRELEGNLNQLIFKAILYNPKTINLDFAISAFKDNPKGKQIGALSSAKIKKIVCDFYGLTRLQLESKSKTLAIANARHIAIYLCRKHLDMAFSKIGDEFGGRDHSTVMASCVKMENLIKSDESFAAAISKIEKKLGI